MISSRGQLTPATNYDDKFWDCMVVFNQPKDITNHSILEYSFIDTMVFGLFKERDFDPDRFEKSLKQISKKIIYREKQQKKLIKNKSYFKRQLVIYSLGVYLSYLGYAYFVLGTDNISKFELALIISGPILILSLYYTVDYLYAKLINRNELQLTKLRDSHQETIDNLKDSTNFHQINDLLLRFGTGEDIKELENEANEILAKREEYLQLINQGDSQEEALKKLDIANTGKGSIYEKLVNSIMGPDQIGGPNERYALICSNCHQHNGLAPLNEQPEYVEYICPRCGIMNGMARPVATGDQDDNESR